MDKNTYEALKELVDFVEINDQEPTEMTDQLQLVRFWIEEVAKDYEEKQCDKCGKYISDLEYANGNGLCINCR